jgi:RNA polymerase sigma-70 factor (ECF subfamily)
MDKVIDREWKLYLSNMAMERLSKTFSENIITAFKMGLEGVSAEDSAEQLGMTVRSIYSLRSRVKKVFLREVRTLMEEYEE